VTLLIQAQTGLQLGLIMALAVFGLAIAYRLFNFPDLTIEGSFLLGAVGFAVLNREGFSLAASFLGATAFGALAGGVTGGLHSRFQINKFLTGILVTAIAYSLSLRMMAGPNVGLLEVSASVDALMASASPFDRDLTRIAVLAIVVAVVGILVVVLLRSRLGLQIRVAGCNPQLARSIDVKVVWSYIIGLGLTNALSAMSGALLAVHQGFSDVGLGQGMLVFALASLSIGERLLSDRKMSLPMFVLAAAVSGSVVYQCLIAWAVGAGLNPIDLKMATGILVLLVIIMRRKHLSALGAAES